MAGSERRKRRDQVVQDICIALVLLGLGVFLSPLL
jgi:hypothetical protein